VCSKRNCTASTVAPANITTALYAEKNEEEK
jgi:hypothetical protein